MRSRSAVLAAVFVAAGLSGVGGPPAAAAPSGTCGPMDVALVLDTTSSTSNAMNDIQAKIGSITTAVKTASGNDYRIGVVTFSNDVEVHSQFVAGNKAAIDTLVPLLDGPPGGANPEASDEAVHTAARNLADGPARPDQTGDFTAPWRGHATKAIVLVTDALPGGFDDLHGPADIASADAAAQAAFDRGVKIHAILPPTNDPAPVAAVMNNYATQTGGSFVQTDDPGTAAAIIAALSDCDRSDVFVRDSAADTGAEPQPAVAQSPDISLCASQNVSCPPVSTFTAAPGTTAFFHIRLGNPGPNGSGITVGTLKLYRSGFHDNAQWPLQWTQMAAVEVIVPVGGKTVVIPWSTTVADTTFMTRWVSPTDPMTAAETNSITTNIKNNNNQAWRRILVNPDPG
jgi:von Willebrand factor type A domain-containing protein